MKDPLLERTVNFGSSRLPSVALNDYVLHRERPEQNVLRDRVKHGDGGKRVLLTATHDRYWSGQNTG